MAILAANNWYFVSAYLAVLGAGAIAVPLNPQSPAPEIERELAATGAKLALVGPSGRKVAEAVDRSELADYEGVVDVADLLATDPAPLVDRAADDVAVLLFTSGTAGAPRPAMLTHGNLTREPRPGPRQPRPSRRGRRGGARACCRCSTCSG